MMAADPMAKTVVKMDGKAGVLAAIASFLGFHPQDSLCVVCLGGSRRRLGLVMRCDLADVDIAQIVGVAKRHADEVILVVYAGPDVEYDLGSLARALAEVVPVLDVIEVGNDSQPTDPTLEAANAMVGRGLLDGGRAAVVASVAYGGTDGGAVPPRLWGTAAERDALLATLVRDAKKWLPALIIAMTRTADTDPQLPDLAAVTAMVAYRVGDGALAQVCLDRVFAIQPKHRLAVLLTAAISAGLPPQALDGIVEDL